MTQNEQISMIAAETDLSQAQVREVLTVYSRLAVEVLRDKEEFVLFGIGKLKAKDTLERTGRNPSTGEPMKIRAGRRVSLTVGKRFKEKVGEKDQEEKNDGKKEERKKEKRKP